MLWPIATPPTDIPAGYKFGAPRTTTTPPHPHGGLDMGVLGEPVYAAEAGTVTFSGESSGLGGLMVYIKHDGGWETRYMHLATGSILVKKGDVVAAGQQIAKVGTTGITSSAAHLHFEVLQNGVRIDPESVLGGIALATVLLLAGVAWVVYKVLR